MDTGDPRGSTALPLSSGDRRQQAVGRKHAASVRSPDGVHGRPHRALAATRSGMKAALSFAKVAEA
jgi:hypothetical protein